MKVFNDIVAFQNYFVKNIGVNKIKKHMISKEEFIERFGEEAYLDLPKKAIVYADGEFILEEYLPD